MQHPALQRFADNLSSRPFCSNNGTATRIRQKHLAIEYSHISLNRRRVAYLAFDVDRQGAAFAWESANLPPPTLTMINPENAHAHLLYELVAPVPASELSRPKPLRLLAAVESQMGVELGADPGFAGLIIKNPCVAWAWRVVANDLRYDLTQLLEFLPDRQQSSKPAAEAAGWGRNCEMFDTLRRWAYQRVGEGRAMGLEAWVEACRDKARAINQTFANPLPDCEARATGKSVASWTFKNYRGTSSLDQVEKAAQALAVQHGLDVATVYQCLQTEIARMAGISDRQFRRVRQLETMR